MTTSSIWRSEEAQFGYNQSPISISRVYVWESPPTPPGLDHILLSLPSQPCRPAAELAVAGSRHQRSENVSQQSHKPGFTEVEDWPVVS